MRFQITNIKKNTIERFKEKYGKILEKYSVEYINKEHIKEEHEDCLYLSDKDSENHFYIFIEIESIEDLLSLKSELKEALVIRDGWMRNVSVIEIYDDYRE